MKGHVEFSISIYNAISGSISAKQIDLNLLFVDHACLTGSVMVNWAIKSNIFHPNLSNKAMDDANELVKKIQAGDTNSFRKLIERYQRVVSHIVFRLIYQPKDREDICQDVFLQVYQNLANFKFESKLSTWIGQIAYHRCLNYLEKKRTPL